MADGSYRFSISVEGGDAGTRALAAVADGQERVASTGDRASAAMGRTAQAATGSGGLLSAWGRIDDGAGKVMRSMGGLNDVLDIAKLALGVGLSGPIGAVVMGLGELFGAADLVKGMFGETATATKDLGAEQAAAAVAARDHAKALGEVVTAGRRLAGSRLGVDASTLGGRAVLAGTIAEQEVAKIRAEQERLAVVLGTQVERAQGLAGRIDAEGAKVGLVAASTDVQREIADTVKQLDHLRERSVDAERALRQVFGVTATTPTATSPRGTPRVSAPKAKADDKAAAAAAAEAAAIQSEIATQTERTRLEGIASPELDELMESIGRGAPDAVTALTPLTDTLSAMNVAMNEAIDIAPTWQEQLGGSLKGFAEESGEYLQSQADNFDGVLTEFTRSASNLASFAASAIQSVAGAIGTSMAAMVAGVGKGSKGLRTSIGDIALMLSQQAFTFATYLAAMGVVASIPGLRVLTAAMTGGATAPTLFTAAAVMGGVGLSLGLTARAFGTSQSGSGARASSGGGSSGSGGGSSGGGFGSFGGQSDRPIEVTVILSADALHDSVVTTSGQRARSGSISSPRLAVAGGF